LLKIWEDLAPHGRAAIILPAEFLNANFGAEIKERLVRSIRPAAVLVFSPAVNLFADALTTSAIVLLEKNRPRDAISWLARVDSMDDARNFARKLSIGGKVTDSDACLKLDSLISAEKWLNRLFHGRHSADRALLPKHVGDYFDCRRGIATGANDYFCLTPSGMQSHSLSEEHFVPCITKATDAHGLVFSPEKLLALISRDRRCYLLNPTRIGTSLRRYLELGERQQIHLRHLPSHRPVWYQPENRPVADIWVAVFSRESTKFILNTSGAKSLTCFHGLHAKTGNELLPPLMTLFLNSSLGRRAFMEVNRYYGDGLNKLEPKDVEAMRCPVMPELTKLASLEITRTLSALEPLPPVVRLAKIDELITHHFNLSPFPAIPSVLPGHPKRSRRPVAPHTHRAVPMLSPGALR
jgi:adenine-specific DNA-methyltransferase